MLQYRYAADVGMCLFNVDKKVRSGRKCALIELLRVKPCTHSGMLEQFLVHGEYTIAIRSYDVQLA